MITVSDTVYQPSSCIEYRLKMALQIGWEISQHCITVIQIGMHQSDHQSLEGTKRWIWRSWRSAAKDRETVLVTSVHISRWQSTKMTRFQTDVAGSTEQPSISGGRVGSWCQFTRQDFIIVRIWLKLARSHPASRLVSGVVSLEISGGKFLEIPSNLSGNLLQIFSLERFRPAWLDK